MEQIYPAYSDVRQSPSFALFMEDLGWQVLQIHHSNIFLRKFPLIGNFAKLPKPRVLPPSVSLSSWRMQHAVFHLKVAPHMTSDAFRASFRDSFLANRFSVDSFPFTPTTTIHFDLSCGEDALFQNFSSAKRRGVRRARTHGVTVRESEDISAFVSLRAKQYAPFGFLVVSETRSLWTRFFPHSATLLLAYRRFDTQPVSGIFLLFHDRVSYYWFATSTQEGKILFAPSLLVWEALKLAKRRGCSLFDFEGIYDPRFPKASASWRGFTKFKEGFGGKTVCFSENFFTKRPLLFF